MAAKSSFLPRLSLSRGDAPILPFHNPTKAPIRRKPSEYNMSDLSPRSEEALLVSPSSGRRSPSPSAGFSDKASTAGSASKTKPRVLFTGPPPPIAASRLLYRDEEDRNTSHPQRSFDASSIARNINSVIFDRVSPAARASNQGGDYEPDTVWRNLQHRERALQAELQRVLDAQSAGLAAHFDPDGGGASSSGNRSNASDAGSASNPRRSRIGLEQSTRTVQRGEIVPVRQPRQKPMGLRAARAGLARNMSLLADLKAEEDANLTAALSTRKKALAQLRKLSARREDITEELRLLESDKEDPLARELRELEEENEGVSTEIAELQERLLGLRNRKRWIDGRLENVKNRREAGLSGYKGALKDVETRVSAILRTPPVKPLDLEAIAGSQEPSHGSESGSKNNSDTIEVEQSPGGAEFLRLRPDRRTIQMAREWWDLEVAILERRKREVDNERTALEDGVEVWKSAVELVSNFEAGLSKEIKHDHDHEGKGKDKSVETTPEQAMYAQLDKIASVIAGLEERVQIAEDRGWNLLICAIGAELSAFREADIMLREALRAARFETSDDDGEKTTTNSGGLATMRNSAFNSLGTGNVNKPLVDLDSHEDRSLESDNEVPADLLVSHQPETPASPSLSREDSENEVPPEFLAEH
ncbi:hypothetical protein B0T17DRAFT_461663, partial [Bombardia bombarda]